MPTMKMLGVLAAGAALSTLPLAASAQNLTALNVEGRAPTEVRISLAGKTTPQVRHEVHAAARTVCNNAVNNRDIPSGDVDGCRRASADRAMVRYAAIVRHNRTLASSADIVLAVR